MLQLVANLMCSYYTTGESCQYVLLAYVNTACVTTKQMFFVLVEKSSPSKANENTKGYNWNHLESLTLPLAYCLILQLVA